MKGVILSSYKLSHLFQASLQSRIYPQFLCRRPGNTSIVAESALPAFSSIKDGLLSQVGNRRRRLIVGYSDNEVSVRRAGSSPIATSAHY
jgi:hypothetical protein